VIELSLYEAADLGIREPVTPKFVDEFSRESAGGASAPGPPPILMYGDERSRAVSKFDHAFPVEFRVSLDNRVRTDDEILSQRTNRRQLIAWTQETTLNGVPDLLH